MSAPSFNLEVLATEENFDESGYLAANPDVAAAVSEGSILSGLVHFRAFGQKEHRRLLAEANIGAARKRKMEKLRPFLRPDLSHRLLGDKYDYLTAALRAETAIVDTCNVSANGYDGTALDLIHSNATGLVLDCGAGKRDVYYENVVNYEIVNYDSTDVLGVAESLPFRDGTFDAALSIAVLEHVRDPFRAASELVRVLKPGGRLMCAVPFLQPLHGYPHHYYNMTHEGLRALFERSLHVDDQYVPDSTLPIWTLCWFLQSWADGLPSQVQEQFLNTRVRDLVGNPQRHLNEPFVRSLPKETNFELASGTVLLATK